MKTLYTRIVLTFVLIALVSGLVGLLLTSFYYESILRSDNERKALGIAETVRDLYARTPDLDLDDYLPRIAALGYQIYATDSPAGTGRFYGTAFKRGKLGEEQIRQVLEGQTYRGMTLENRRIELFAYFENSVRNTVGVRVQTRGGPVALFIRPDLERQIGEVRIIVAVLILGTFAVSLLLIVALSRLIVKPIQKLTRATGLIEQGRYDLQLDVSRRDEIGNLARRFAKMARSIAQLEERRQAFVANVSHEFQTPLTSIQGFARTAREEGTTPEQVDQALAVIEAESGRLSSLGKQLLTLAFLDQESEIRKKTLFRLDEQIRQVLITLEWQWSERNLSLELELPETTIAADPELLHEVWLNLLANSIKFTEPGGAIGIRIKGSAEESEAAGSRPAAGRAVGGASPGGGGAAGGCETADGVAVEISDSGIGIAEEELPLIFERFHKADPARGRSASETSGSGLGLAIVHRIVTLHGGTIRVLSEPGSGTTFTVTLPRL